MFIIVPQINFNSSKVRLEHVMLLNVELIKIISIPVRYDWNSQGDDVPDDANYFNSSKVRLEQESIHQRKAKIKFQFQ